MPFLRRGALLAGFFSEKVRVPSGGRDEGRRRPFPTLRTRAVGRGGLGATRAPPARRLGVPRKRARRPGGHPSSARRSGSRLEGGPPPPRQPPARLPPAIIAFHQLLSFPLPAPRHKGLNPGGGRGRPAGGLARVGEWEGWSAVPAARWRVQWDFKGRGPAQQLPADKGPAPGVGNRTLGELGEGRGRRYWEEEALTIPLISAGIRDIL